uniref:C2H2-type domain-containing protein n=1 Tax=Glossina morsitans morsitans TaxID=37546 RepID=A0A1B0GAM4_GLOMM
MYDHNDDNEGEEPDDNAIMPEANLPPFNNVNPKYCLLNIISVDGVYDLERPYNCAVCSKYFKRQDDLNRHMRMHIGEKPFKCNERDKGFKGSEYAYQANMSFAWHRRR